MEELKRIYTYLLKQYERKGFGHSYYFIDCYLNGRLTSSTLINFLLNKEELDRFFNVLMERFNKGDDVDFFDSTEIAMNKLFLKGKSNLANLESTLSSIMGKSRFDKHYESSCYYLMFRQTDSSSEAHETFWISENCTPLMALKMADQLGKEIGTPYRILLSDKATEVDPELLQFALSEE